MEKLFRNFETKTKTSKSPFKNSKAGRTFGVLQIPTEVGYYITHNPVSLIEGDVQKAVGVFVSQFSIEGGANRRGSCWWVIQLLKGVLISNGDRANSLEINRRGGASIRDTRLHRRTQ